MKTKFSSAVSLTQQQINWLRQQPNGSEKIAKIIDAFIAVDRVTPEAFRAVQLHLSLEHLNEKLSAAILKRQELLRANEWHFKRVKWSDGIHTDSYVENSENPSPIDLDGRVIKCVLDDYNASIAQMQSEILRLKNELLQLSTRQIQE